MTQIEPFDFDKQNKLGKLGEKAVFQYLSDKSETVEIVNLSENSDFQALGIDAQWIYEIPRTGILYSTFFDVKTDFKVHKTGNLFIETVSTDKNKGCLLTTKAEEFMYYDPILGKLYRVPIAPLREWYDKYGSSYEKVSIKNKTYSSEGFLMKVSKLQDLFFIEPEDIPPLSGIEDAA